MIFKMTVSYKNVNLMESFYSGREINVFSKEIKENLVFIIHYGPCNNIYFYVNIYIIYYNIGI